MPPTRSKRPLYLAVLLIAAVLLIGLAYYIRLTSSHAGKLAVKVYVLPTTATITIDGAAASLGTAYLTPGNHTVAASDSGWKSQTRQFFVRADPPTVIDMSLDPISAAANQWMNEHQSLYIAAEGRAGHQSQLNGAAFQDANPIVKQLPFENFLYSIGYKLDPADPSGQSIILTVNAATGYRNAAVQKIRDLGFDPTDFKVIFNDYKDPFSS